MSGTALAETVSGTIQNLGVKGTVNAENDGEGTITNKLTGTIRNTYSAATIETTDIYNTVGGLVGNLTGGNIQNCYYAGTISNFSGAIAAYNTSAESQIANCYYYGTGTGLSIVAMPSSNAQITDCAAKSADELKTEATVEKKKHAVQVKRHRQ